jgi:hypothetical protein
MMAPQTLEPAEKELFDINENARIFATRNGKILRRRYSHVAFHVHLSTNGLAICHSPRVVLQLASPRARSKTSPS